MNDEFRRKVERRIVKLVVQGLIAHGYSVNVDNGGDDMELARPSRVADEVMSAALATDSESLIAYRADGSIAGAVLLVYGNEGYDTVNDYSIALEPCLSSVNAYADRMEQEYGS